LTIRRSGRLPASLRITERPRSSISAIMRPRLKAFTGRDGPKRLSGDYRAKPWRILITPAGITAINGVIRRGSVYFDLRDTVLAAAADQEEPKDIALEHTAPKAVRLKAARRTESEDALFLVWDGDRCQYRDLKQITAEDKLCWRWCAAQTRPRCACGRRSR
jgi:hypothetical protein